MGCNCLPLSASASAVMESAISSGVSLVVHPGQHPAGDPVRGCQHPQHGGGQVALCTAEQGDEDRVGAMAVRP
jgi:hypothetical protein